MGYGIGFLVVVLGLFAAPAARGGHTQKGIRLWPGGVIPYVIDGSIPAHQRELIQQAVLAYDRAVGIRFLPRSTEGDYVIFTVGESASSEALGRKGGAQKLFLGRGAYFGIVLHEMGHVVGLAHEQARADRQEYIRVNLAGMDLLRAFRNTPNSCGGIPIGPYDLESVMHYPSRGEFYSKIPGRPLGDRFRDAFSPGDIDAIRRLYGGEFDLRPLPGNQLDLLFCNLRRPAGQQYLHEIYWHHVGMEQRAGRQVTRGFSDSLVNDLDLVVTLHRDVLGREFTPNDVPYWFTTLLRGTSGQAVVNYVTYSGEYAGRMVDDAYGRCLGRPADPGGRNHFVHLLTHGGSYGDLVRTLITSDEFLWRSGFSPHRFVDSAYRCALRRGASWPEQVARVQQAGPRWTSPATRHTFAEGLVTAPEYQQNTVAAVYWALLRRGPDSAAFLHGGYSVRMARGDFRPLMAGVLASDEYMWHRVVLFPYP